LCALLFRLVFTESGVGGETRKGLQPGSGSQRTVPLVETASKSALEVCPEEIAKIAESAKKSKFEERAKPAFSRCT
jgi:hypothetical protein